MLPTTTCLPGYATDVWLRYRDATVDPCDVPLAIYLPLLVTLLVLASCTFLFACCSLAWRGLSKGGRPFIRYTALLGLFQVLFLSLSLLLPGFSTMESLSAAVILIHAGIQLANFRLASLWIVLSIDFVNKTATSFMQSSNAVTLVRRRNMVSVGLNSMMGLLAVSATLGAAAPRYDPRSPLHSVFWSQDVFGLIFWLAILCFTLGGGGMVALNLFSTFRALMPRNTSSSGAMPELVKKIKRFVFLLKVLFAYSLVLVASSGILVLVVSSDAIFGCRWYLVLLFQFNFVFFQTVNLYMHGPRLAQMLSSMSSPGSHNMHNLVSISFSPSFQAHDQVEVHGADGQVAQFEVGQLAQKVVHADMIAPGGSVSILTPHSIPLRMEDGILETTLPRIAAKVHGAVSSLGPKPNVWLVSILQLCLLALNLVLVTGSMPVLASVINVVSASAMIMLFLFQTSRLVLAALARTFFWRLRLFTTSLLFVLLVAMTQDCRSLIFVLLALQQMLAFSSDAFTGPNAGRLRLVIVFNVMLFTLGVFGLLMTDSIRGAINMAVAVDPSSPNAYTYSLMQLARDLLVVQTAFLAAEVAFVSRGKNFKRFAHLGAPVERIIVPWSLNSYHQHQKQVADESGFYHASKGKPHKKAGHSTLVAKSGFFLQKARSMGEDQAGVAGSPDAPTSSPPHKTIVYLDRVSLRQEDALAFGTLGPHHGPRVFQMLTDKRVRQLLSVSWHFSASATVICVGLGLDTTWIACAVLLAVDVMRTSRDLLLSSKAILRFLLGRIAFWAVFASTLVWVVAAGLVLRDVRVVFPICIWFRVLGHVLMDAYLSVLNVGHAVQLLYQGFLVMAFSLLFLLQIPPDLSRVLIDLRPDTAAARGGPSDPSYSNSPSVFDCFQFFVDGGLSLGMFTMIGALMYGFALVAHGGRQFFINVKAPILPLHEMGGDALRFFA